MYIRSEVEKNIMNMVYPEVIQTIYNDSELFFKTVSKAIHDRKQIDEDVAVSFGLMHDLVNFENQYRTDMRTKDGFEIDTSVVYDPLYDEVAFLTSKSIHSYKFGISSKDSDEVQIKRYSCECGELESPIAGLVCNKCGTTTDLRVCKRGWFDLGNYKVLNPQFFFQLASSMTSANAQRLLDDLFNYSHKVKNKDEKKDKERKEIINIFDLQDRDVLIKWICDNIAESKRDYFLANIDSAMSSKLPVMSKDFRPFRVIYNLNGEPSIESHELNQKYRLINDKLRMLKSKEDNIDNLFSQGYSRRRYKAKYEIFRLLEGIQRLIFNIHEITIDGMTDKKDEIRLRFGSTKLPYSSRNVMESYLGVYSDEIILPYNIFGENIIGYYRDYLDKYGITPESINRILSNAPNEADKEMLDKVLEDMSRDNVNYCFGYRPPSIGKRSAVGLRIIGLTESEVVKLTEITIDVCLKGDKDGDTFTNFILERAFNAIIYFAHHPSAMTWNPMTGLAEKYELPESLYLICYDLLGKYDKNKEYLIRGKKKDLDKIYHFIEPKCTHVQTTFPQSKEDIIIKCKNGLMYL